MRARADLSAINSPAVHIHGRTVTPLLVNSSTSGTSSYYRDITFSCFVYLYLVLKVRLSDGTAGMSRRRREMIEGICRKRSSGRGLNIHNSSYHHILNKLCSTRSCVYT